MKMTAIKLWGRSVLSIGLSALGLLFAAECVSAEVIASVANPDASLSAGILTSVDEANEVWWTSTNTYSNVSISASFALISYANVGGIAYLMTQTGTGTTPAAQIAFTNFTFPNSTGGAIKLFQNLTLGPGTYYLVLYSTDPVGGGWLIWTNPAETTAAGVTIGGSGYYYNPGTLKGPYFPYAPSVPFVATQSNEQFIFDVEGQAADFGSVPEPSTFGLLAAAVLLARLIGLLASRRVLRR